MRTLIIICSAIITLMGSAQAGATDYQCMQGHKSTPYQRLKITLRGKVVQKITYENELGQQEGGAWFGCTVSASRGDEQISWSLEDQNQRLRFKDKDAEGTSILIKDEPTSIIIAFEGSDRYFCGANSALPKKIVLEKKTRTCNFYGPDL
ncbi:hypothetical protein [Nevskia ramosa]|uniref:hypothetical protein n=1 Tax=Nevskia ramosa TaxID=64002 RepID=UPI003D109CC4